MSELRTPRILLRRWQDDDLDAFAEVTAQPEVMRWIHDGEPLDRAGTAARLDIYRRHWEEHGFGLFALVLRQTGELAGFTGLAVPTFLPEVMPAVEIGWRLDAGWWGRGVDTEAARAAAGYGLGAAGLDELVSFTAPANVRSRAVMERIGMTHDPADDFDHPRLPPGHHLRRHVLYRLRPDRAQDG
jgi:RimJ/RimL family protein N-acetyltransferase